MRAAHLTLACPGWTAPPTYACLGGRFFAIVVLGGRFLAVCCAAANSMARRESLCKFFPAFDRDVRRFWKSSGTTTASGVVTALAVPIVAGAPACNEEGTRPSMF